MKWPDKKNKGRYCIRSDYSQAYWSLIITDQRTLLNSYYYRLLNLRFHVLSLENWLKYTQAWVIFILAAFQVLYSIKTWQNDNKYNFGLCVFGKICYIMTKHETSNVTVCSSKNLTGYTSPILSMINKLGSFWSDIISVLVFPIHSLHKLFNCTKHGCYLHILLTDARMLLYLAWSIFGRYLITFPVGVIKFASCQFFSILLGCRASRLFFWHIT